jgi:hypothetical protein
MVGYSPDGTAGDELMPDKSFDTDTPRLLWSKLALG